MTEREFRERVLNLHRLMYGVALRMGILPDDAADAVQETQLKLWRNRNSIPEEEKELKMYCMAALRNECISWFRRQRPKAGDADLSMIEAPPSHEAEWHDSRHRIEILIESLPPGQRKVIRLSSFGAMGNQEIAEAMGQTEANVRQLLSRARRKLRELWNKE